ncbi:MAG: peptidase MA family metallohydrolase [Chloroflexota bacterium]
MIKKAGVLASSVFLFLALFSPVLAQGGTGLTVKDSSVQADFPGNLSFNIKAESNVNITDIRLRYTVDRESFARVTSEAFVEFVPATNVDADWTWDMRRTGGLPPGTNLEYWWTVTDASGKVTETKPVSVRFDDKRHTWRSVTEGKVSIYWYEGDQNFANALMSAAQQALVRLAKDTGASPEKQCMIYIYNGARDLQGALVFPQEWTGGVSFSGYNIIAIGIAPRDLEWGKRAMTHELTHLVINQVTLNPYNGLPVWLNEGLAMYNEGPLESGFANIFNAAIASNALISVRSLASPFSADSQEAYLSYAESYSLVEFLVTHYGQEKMVALLETFRQGSTADNALLKAYGFDMDGLNTAWKTYITSKPTSKIIDEKSPALISKLLSVFGLATGSLAWGWSW